jgi:sialate O-acetylesterase
MKAMRRRLLAIGLPLTLAFAPPAQAADMPLLHEMFQDHAVLQRDRPIRIWGDVQPGADVTVSLAGKATRVRANAEGRWQAQLSAMKAGGPYTLSARSGTNTQTVDDILIGDVWLCSGQSNMELQVKRTRDSRSEIEGAHNDRIRLLKVGQKESVAPREHFAMPVRWEKTTPQAVPEFSAACYYFARELQKTIDVPMGLINSSWGGARMTCLARSGARHRANSAHGKPGAFRSSLRSTACCGIAGRSS